MALSIRERILQAIVTALQTIDGVEVLRNEPMSTEADGTPRLIVQDGGQSANEETYGATAYTLRAAVDGRVWAASGENPGTAMNALYVQAMAALFADRTLGGLAIDLREGAMDEPALDGETGNAIGAFRVAIEIDFWTKSNDPTALGPA